MVSCRCTSKLFEVVGAGELGNGGKAWTGDAEIGLDDDRISHQDSIVIMGNTPESLKEAVVGVVGF